MVYKNPVYFDVKENCHPLPISKRSKNISEKNLETLINVLRSHGCHAGNSGRQANNALLVVVVFVVVVFVLVVLSELTLLRLTGI